MRRRVMKFACAVGATLLLAAGITTASIGPTAKVSTASATTTGSQFNASDIIDDSVFYNPTTMTQASIQTFLQQHETGCAPSAGNPGCLDNFVSSTPARDANAECAAFPAETNQLASQIIFDAAEACGVNPQVILVTLQKEEGLVTSTNPSGPAYNAAMGYYCPDTSPTCNGAYAGFGTQVYDAVWQFEYYKLFPTHFNYVAGRNNTIAYVPSTNTTCTAARSSVVYIDNEATAGLYDYTPYQPNAAALANMYGTGDACSSYGNRNFFVYFNDWFGSPTLSPNAAAFVQALYADILNRAPSAAEITGWGDEIMEGTPTAQVAAGFVNSDEYRLIRINAAYQNVLGRPASPAEAQGWLSEMKAGIIQTDDVDRTFYSSQEFYNKSGSDPSNPATATNETFVNALYVALIGRPASADEQNGWGAIVATRGTGYVVTQIWNSQETARSRVILMYQKYLNRTPSLNEANGWAALDLSQGDGQVRWDILGSQEYYNDSLTRFPPAAN